MKKRLLFIAPHLSTGGMPQYLYKLIEELLNDFEVWCIEWSNVTGGVLVVQRNRISEALGSRLITLEEDKNELFNHIEFINPDIIHLKEIPEMFMDYDIALKLYSTNRKYVIIETSHDSSYDVSKKVHFPDKFMLVSRYQIQEYSKLNIPCELVEYPIEYKDRKRSREDILKELNLDPSYKHIINVGLFTPRKNQVEVIEYARLMKDYPVKFHFIGNQADNFKYYWEPLMKDLPNNCIWWGERSDVDTFYQMADLMLFTSKGGPGDKETMPLVIREAISWRLSTFIYNLDVYLNYFDDYSNISYFDDFDKIKNVDKIIKLLELDNKDIFYTLEGKKDLKNIEYPNSMYDTMIQHGDAAAMYWGTFLYKELDKYDVLVEPGDVFLDLGANIGMSSKYAFLKGAKEIYAFEPDPTISDLLRKNVPTAKIFQYAVDSKSNEFELYHWPYNEINVGPKYKCKSLTLKQILDIIDCEIVDYLKIDIEGFENNLFDDLSYEDCSRFKKIFIEHHIQDQIDIFAKKLIDKGYDIIVDYGNGQNYIYGKHKKYKNINTINNNMIIQSNWDREEQKMYFSTSEDINYPVYVSLKEYKSDAVLWYCHYESLSKNIQFWIMPIPKHMKDYSADINFSGIKICIYKADTEEQIYEYPYFEKFVNIPTITLSNIISYYINYVEFFVDKKYDSFFANKKFKNIVDAGANVGVFTYYALKNELTQKVISIECDPYAVKDLSNNFKNDCRVKIINKALYSENNKISFYQSEINPVISSTIPPDKLKNHNAGIKGDKEIIVDTVTIENLIDELGFIDFLKIDIEGAEYNIIEKLDSNLFKYINNIYIECHFFEEDYMSKYSNLVEKLTKNGYTILEFKEKQAELYKGGSEMIYAYK